MVQLLRLLKHLAHGRDIMAVHRAQIGNAHILKQHSGYEQLLDAVLGALDLVYHHRPHNRYPVKGICHILL